MARYGIPDELKLCRTVVRCTQVENPKPSPKNTGSSTSQRVSTTINQMVKLSLLSRKQIRPLRSLQSDPYLVLLAHCNTPQEGFGTSPAQRLLSRRTKKNIPTSSNLLKPNVAEGTLEKDKLRKLKQKFYYERSAKHLPDLQNDDVVWIQPFQLKEKTWSKAKVVKPLGKRSYAVESSGQLYIRNRRHLKRSAESERSLTEE